MSLTATILLLIFSWLAVAGAMLWGVMRVTRRHHHPVTPAKPAAPEPPRKPAGYHA
ncbi:MAG: hypothetical protein GAK37_00810 [Pseudomonas sp.]|nr:MAG: hypothetical protein GAK37_00810 [Pseudomonas sp.]